MHPSPARAVAAVPPPMSRGALLLLVGGALIVALFLWGTPALYPMRLLVTLMHETGHAVMARLAGGTVESVSISPTAGGLTVWRIPRSTTWHLLVISGGYLGSAGAGALLLAAAAHLRTGRLVLGALAAWLVAVSVFWVRLVPPQVAGSVATASGYSRSDGLFTLAFALLAAAALFALAWKGPVWLRRVVIVWIATLSCLAALEDVKRLFGYGLSGSSSDADLMAQQTGIPAAVWAAAWMVLSVGAVGVGVRALLRAGRRGRAEAGQATVSS